jgi:hypothetical protein
MATTTPNYGWDVPTSSDYVKNGATAIETLGDDIDATLWTALGGNYPGLRLIKKQTIGTAVASVQVTGAFSADYENYLILVSGGVSSVATVINMTLGATTTGYFGSYISCAYNSTTVTGANDNNAARWLYAGYGSTDNLTCRIDLATPFLTKNTFIRSVYATASNTGSAGPYNGYLSNTTSYTAFTLTCNTGGATMTGGIIYVYGYGAS